MREKQIKVSVIIPAYNADKYIEECISSLLAQTLQEFEAICVDDGSTDSTLEILERFAKEDNRIKVYHQKNRYAGTARNLGMSYAEGKYLIFLDADDFFEKTLLEKVYEEAERCDAQVVLFRANVFDNQKQKIMPMPWSFERKFVPDSVPFSAKQAPNLLRSVTSAPWTKCFLREYIIQNNLRFQEFQNANDVLFIFTALAAADRISYVDESLIYYRKGLADNVQSRKYKQPLAFLNAYSDAFHELQKRGLYSYVKKGFHEAVIFGCMHNYGTSKDAKIRSIIKEAFLSDRFEEMNLFEEEGEKGHSGYFYQLQGLVKGIKNELFLKEIQKKSDASIFFDAELEKGNLWKIEETIQLWLKNSPEEVRGFAEVYAWFCIYLELCGYAGNTEYAERKEADDISEKVFSAVLQEAVDRYGKLPENEKHIFLTLDNKTQSLFRALIVYSKTALDEQKKKAAYIRKENSNLKERLKAAREKQKAVEEKFVRIRTSKAYKIGKVLMWLPWKIKQLFSKKNRKTE